MTCINFSRIAAVASLTAGIFLTGCSFSPVSKGVVQGQLAICPNTPNCVSSYNGDGTHKIAPLRFKGDATVALNRLKSVLGTRKDADIVQTDGNYVRVTFTTPVMQFVDDAEFLVLSDSIEVRSAARMGYSDLGKNRSRIEEIRALFEPCCN